MIDEQRTHEIYGYVSAELPPSSHKPIVCICEECGHARVAQKRRYSFLCQNCSNGIKSRNSADHRRELLNSPDRIVTKIKTKNKNSPTFLGCAVAEKVLLNAFKNVKQMPNCFPGYDFLCGKGYRVDVKSSTARKGGYWAFHIDKNDVCDYFACLAFNNREDLIPSHFWLIPSRVLSHLIGTSISPATLDKWNEYEKPLDKIMECCDTMKVISSH